MSRPSGAARTALVVGAGPAGLMAAEEMARAGLAVTVAEAMPSPARKLLMAGKSGLNLTMDRPLPDFLDGFGPGLPPAVAAAVAEFGPAEVAAWARGLGQEVFTGSTGRVFPVAMKASPLLRAWLRRLDGLGVALRTRWRWTGWDGGGLRFDTPDGPRTERPDATVLACGGASWRRLGSDGAWAGWIGTGVTPFAPANVGLRVDWSPHMSPLFGTPVKGAALHAGATTSRGEFVISERGLEGGGIYAIGRSVREGAELRLDLLPDLSSGEIRARLASAPARQSLSNRLRRNLGLDPARISLLNEFGRPLPGDLAPLLKALPVRHAGPRPLDEAISTAGGLSFEALHGLELKDRPGTFAAGEMLDWEAPTGGWLITASLATGRAAGRAAAARAGGAAPCG
ncbi:TIGR03862 family flavoprotein [Wenxinia marina]|uniref:TIGR03862 family flavoprotein n=1 Tax=Wenxinia marina TaxID=390641 RepID=UPI000379F4DD|nr:TIGR03862 family flavoprotein [Wenxinia marina]